MSNKRYIQLDSDYRDRLNYPLQSYFEVDINTVTNTYTCTYPVDIIAKNNGLNYYADGSIGPETSTPIYPTSNVITFTNPSNLRDPVSEGAPAYVFRAQSEFNYTGTIGLTGCGCPVAYVAYTGASVQKLVGIDDFYNGYFAEGADGEIRQIVSYDSCTSKFCFDKPFTGTSFSPIYIRDPGTYNTDLSPNPIYETDFVIHLQYQSLFQKDHPIYNQSFIGYYAYNDTRGSYGKIVSYDPHTRVAKVVKDPIISGLNFIGDNNQYQADDVISIRKTLPQYSGNAAITFSAEADELTIPGTIASGITSDCVPYIYFIPQFTSSHPPPYPYPPTPSTYTSDYGLESYNDDNRINHFVYPISSINYTGGNTVIRLQRPIDLVNTSGNFSAIQQSSIDLNAATRSFQIFCANYDNYKPIIYSGVLASQSDVVCYEMELISLTLPNVTLKTGDRIAFYPYIFVQLTNVSSPMKAPR